MAQARSANSFLQRGALYQLPMIIVFIWRRMYLLPALESLASSLFVAVSVLVGLIMFGYCLYVLYVRRSAGASLITTGLFRYTRHPMYTGLVLMDLNAFWSPWTLAVIISSILFYGLLITAAYFQEKETLARFGTAAEEYYTRTPRLIIMYPWKKLTMQRSGST